MIAFAFDERQYFRLQKLLNLPPNVTPTADHIMNAVERALQITQAAEKEKDIALSLNKGGRQRHGNPLLADARRRQVADLLKK